MVQFIPESPRFLYANKRYDEAREVLKKVAKFNGVKITPLEISSIVFDTEIELDNKKANVIGDSD